MARLLKLRRGTTSEHSSFTGAEGEVTIDTTKDTAVVHDGSTAGGRPLLRQDLNNIVAGSITHAMLEGDAIDGDNIGDDVVDSEHIAAGAVDLEHMSSESVDEDNLYISNAGSNGDFLQKQSGNNGGLTWASPSTLSEEQVEDYVGGMLTGNTETGITVTYQDGDGTIDFVVDDTTKLPLAGGTVTGDVVFDNGTNAGKDITWDVSENHLVFSDDTYAKFGDGGDLALYHNATDSYVTNSTGDLYVQTTGSGDDVIITAVDDIFLKPQGGENGIEIAGNGAVTVYHDSTKEFSTVLGGVKLWGHSEQIVTALTSAASVTIDFSVSNHFSCTMGHNISFANPTTEAIGQSGTITLTQPGSGSNHSASWGDQFLWAGGTAPTLTDANNAVDRIDYVVVADGKIHCVATLNLAASS